ncbi:MAG: peptidoglycan-binding protein [Bacteroidota bacterium]
MLTIPEEETGYYGLGRYYLGEKFYKKSREFNRPKRAVENRPVQKKLIPIAEAQLWVREASGQNDGVQVEAFLSAAGLKKGNPWCAAFVSWVHQQAGYNAPRTGWSPALFPVNRLVKAAAPGNVFGIYFPALKRIAHCGFVTRRHGSWVVTVEGNTSIAGSREGDGVYQRMRHFRTLSKYADWTSGK